MVGKYIRFASSDLHWSLYPQRERKEDDYSLAHSQELGEAGASVQARTGQGLGPCFGARSHPRGAAAKRMGWKTALFWWKNHRIIES